MIPLASKGTKSNLVMLNNIELPREETPNYYGFHLDRRLSWRKPIQMIRAELRTKCSKTTRAAMAGMVFKMKPIFWERIHR